MKIYEFYSIFLLPAATKLGQGYIFTGVCHSVNGGVSGPGGCLVLGGCLVETPPRDGHCCGRYASYWNAFLFLVLEEEESEFTVKIIKCNCFCFARKILGCKGKIINVLGISLRQ